MEPKDYYFRILEDDTQSYIEVEDEEGNYVQLSPNGLSYFSPLLSEPLKYNKKIGFGTAEDDEYVDLSNYNFSSPPKIHLAPYNAPLYSNDFPQLNQNLKTDISEQSKDGFRANCYLSIEGSEIETEYSGATLSTSTNNSNEAWIIQSTGENCIKIEYDLEIRLSGGFGSSGEVAVTIDLYEYNDGDEELIEEFFSETHTDKNNNVQFTASTGEIPPNNYRTRVKIALASFYSMSATVEFFRTRESFGSIEKELLGEVSWIAIEAN